MDNKFKDFFDDEIIRINKSEAIKIFSRRFKTDVLEAEKIYNKWRRKWCNINSSRELV